jgi:hypothetical protein
MLLPTIAQLARSELDREARTGLREHQSIDYAFGWMCNRGHFRKISEPNTPAQSHTVWARSKRSAKPYQALVVWACQSGGCVGSVVARARRTIRSRFGFWIGPGHVCHALTPFAAGRM